MTTSFEVALRPFLVLSKTLGLISITYTFDSGLLEKNSSNENNMYCACLELMRMIALIGLTYVFHANNTFYLRELVLLKFWTTVFMARIYEIWIIRLINGIIEFDRRLDGLALTILGKPSVRSSTKYGWNTFLASLLALYLVLQIFSIWLWPPKMLYFGTVVKYFFEIPSVTEFAVFVTTYFYLLNLGSRFKTLNRVCEQLPAGLIATSGTWTQFEITLLMDRAQLLHSELCELLRVFGLGYGGVMLCYFVFNFVDILRNFYYLVHVSRSNPSSNTIANFASLNVILTLMFCLQNVVFVTCLLITVSWINVKKIEIVSFLRLIHISQLPIATKLQVKMFMNQLSVCQWDELTAFGFFNIILKLIISVLILLTTTLATSVQMKEHPYVVSFNNAYHSYLQLEYNVIG